MYIKTTLRISYHSNPGLYHPLLGDFLIDSQFIGNFRQLCDALTTKGRHDVITEIVLSNNKLKSGEYIEMCKLCLRQINEKKDTIEYHVKGLNNYKGEIDFLTKRVFNPTIDTYFFIQVCNIPIPKYIYIKVKQIVKDSIPLRYNLHFLEDYHKGFRS